MKLFEEFFRLLAAEGDLDPARLQFAVAAGVGGYFQNVKGILEFSPARIVLKGRRAVAAIEGRDLSLGRCFQGDVCVRGEIVRVEVREC